MLRIPVAGRKVNRVPTRSLHAADLVLPPLSLFEDWHWVNMCGPVREPVVSTYQWVPSKSTSICSLITFFNRKVKFNLDQQ